MTQLETALAHWRDAERRVDALPHGTPEHAAAEAECNKAQAVYARLVERNASTRGHGSHQWTDVPFAGVRQRLVLDGEGGWSGIVTAAQRVIAQGQRPWYSVQYSRQPDGTYRVVVSDLPNVALVVTGRKGIERAVRERIALVLDVGVDDFDLTVRGCSMPSQSRTAD
jgi:hypothetical protein